MSTATSTPVVLVTGANRTDGIGYAAARQLALQHGFTVILGSRTLTPAFEEAAKQLEKDGAKGGVHTLLIDVTSSDSVKKAAEEVTEKFGRLDVLVNNAGIGMPPSRAYLMKDWPKIKFDSTDHTSKDFDEVFSVNVFGVVDTINAFVPLLAKSSAPRIVNLSSRAGSMAFISSLPADHKGPSSIVYSASKAALNMLTIMFSKDLPKVNPAFKINAASPGFTSTAFNRYMGTRTPEEGAAVVTWLATLPEDGPNGGFYCDHPPYSLKNGEFKSAEW